MVNRKRMLTKDQIIKLREEKTSKREKRITGLTSVSKLKLVALKEVNPLRKGINENINKKELKKKPAVQYDDLGLPRVLGRGARMAHKKWLEENGYERD